MTGAAPPTRSEAEQLDAADGVAGSRDSFTGDGRDDRIYLDGNSLGRPARNRGAGWPPLVEEWGGRLVEGWRDWIDLPATIGDRLAAAVLGAGPGQVVVADSTTVNLYKLAAAGLAARPDRRVVVADGEDFPTDRYVLEGLAAASGIELRLLGGDPSGWASHVGDDTALVCLSHVHYRSGARADMAAVNRAAHDAGALVLWDLSHSAGAIPLHLDDDATDLAVGCTYKYLNAGPGAPAFLYVRRDLQAELRQPIWGWFGQRNQFAMGRGYDPDPGIRRFLTGTPSILGTMAVDAALEPFAQVGIDRLWAKSEALTGLLIDLFDAWLAPLGCRLATPRDPAGGAPTCRSGTPTGGSCAGP